jgi:hypothetical protein
VSSVNVAITIEITRPLSDVFAPVLERLLNQAHELIGHGAVDDAMIVTES